MIQNDTLFMEQFNLKAKELGGLLNKFYPNANRVQSKEDNEPNKLYPSLSNIEFHYAMKIVIAMMSGAYSGIDVGSAVIKLSNEMIKKSTELTNEDITV